jgi:hypothetical protein
MHKQAGYFFIIDALSIFLIIDIVIDAVKNFKAITNEMILDVFKVKTQTMACDTMRHVRLKRSISNLHFFQINSYEIEKIK